MKSALQALMATVLMSSASMGHAQEDWWFDVEVILFDRGQAISQTKEQFDYAPDLAPVSADWDLLGNLLYPDISWLKQNLPVCGQSSSPLWQAQPSLKEITQRYEQWQQAQPGYTQGALPAAPEASSGERPVGALGTSPYASTVDRTTQLNDSPGPDAWAIAGYWLAFNWPEPARVSVPTMTYCEPAQPWIRYQDNEWVVYAPDNHLPAPAQVPIVPSGDDSATASPRILSAKANELEKLSLQIRSTRGLTRLLHTTWRQPVAFGEDNAAAVRLFAGKNYAQQFLLSGQPKQEQLVTLDVDGTPAGPQQERFFEQLSQQLASDEDVPFATLLAAADIADTSLQAKVEKTSVSPHAPIWQMDGYLKVYLKYINQVPYLHIDSMLYYRQPVPMNISQIASGEKPQYKLVSVPFHQMRRVISKQLHYFDHPLFGMVVTLRRSPTSKEQ